MEMDFNHSRHISEGSKCVTQSRQLLSELFVGIIPLESITFVALHQKVAPLPSKAVLS